MTNYIVLKSNDDGGLWRILGAAEASGPEQARKKIDAGEGQFLIVPRRNATFISGAVEQPPPRVTSVEVSADSFLPPREGEPTDEPLEGIEVPADGTEAELVAP